MPSEKPPRLVIRNQDVLRALVGIPEGHQHIRAILFLKQGLVIELQEATLANLVRAYVTIKTHPAVEAVELAQRASASWKPGYAAFQLIETGRPSEEVRRELRRIIEGDRP